MQDQRVCAERERRLSNYAYMCADAAEHRDAEALGGAGDGQEIGQLATISGKYRVQASEP